MNVSEPLLGWYRRAIAAVDGRRTTHDALRAEGIPRRRAHLLAWGKASVPMLQGAADAWPGAIAEALVVTLGAEEARFRDFPFPVRWQHGEHPVPGTGSFAAGVAIAEFLQSVPADAPVRVLLSGGASSLAELPRDGVDPEWLRGLSRQLLGAGLDIRTMNAVRARLSRLKGGGAAALCSSRDLRVLVISDVPGDVVASVGSGPFWPPDSAEPLPAPVPAFPGLEDRLRAMAPSTTRPPRPPHQLIAGNHHARAAVLAAARGRGLSAWDHGLFPVAPCAVVARILIRTLRHAPAGVHVWGGEVPVRLPEMPGRGGRARHLAACLLLLWRARGWPRPLALLAGATDGADGDPMSAGAWFRDGLPSADPATYAALRDALRRADTGSFWDLQGQALPGNATGTNVMDLLIVHLGPRDSSGARAMAGGAPVAREGRPPDLPAQDGAPPLPGARRLPATAGVHAAALRSLRVRDPVRKCECAERLLEAWHVGELQVQATDPPPERLEIPGRPESPVLVRPQDLPRRSLHTEHGRLALLHAIAHIEFNAVNLALDAVYRFRGMPETFISDWLQVAAEEARHFRLLASRLSQAGSFYGAFPAHNGLWEMAVKTDADPLERMALVPRVLEARGLDVTPGMIGRLAAAGDHASVAVLEVIQREEVGHVAIGSRWFRHLALQRGLDPEPTFLKLLARHMPGRVRPPFARDARLAAGFSPAEIAALEAQATDDQGAGTG